MKAEAYRRTRLGGSYGSNSGSCRMRLQIGISLLARLPRLPQQLRGRVPRNDTRHRKRASASRSSQDSALVAYRGRGCPLFSELPGYSACRSRSGHRNSAASLSHLHQKGRLPCGRCKWFQSKSKSWTRNRDCGYRRALRATDPTIARYSRYLRRSRLVNMPSEWAVRQRLCNRIGSESISEPRFLPESNH
jgi:hypothetical protein